MYRRILLPSSLLAATIIGAGIFALPYVFTKAGIGAGLFYLALFGAVFILIHLMYADVILKTQGEHRFLGYAEIYLGKSGKGLAFFSTLVGMTLILAVYLVLSASFINLIAPSLPQIGKTLIFWVLGSIPIFWGINRLTLSEFLITLGIFFIILIIFFFGLKNFNQLSSGSWLNFSYLFLPFGPILFSLNGRAAVPAVIDYFKRNNAALTSIKTPIILGTLMPALVYFIFVVSILSLSPSVSADSVSGLVGRLPIPLLWLLGFLGLINIWSTYIVIGRDIRKNLEIDLGTPKSIARLVAVFAPLLVYFLSSGNFINLIKLTGSIFIGLESILVILIWRKAAASSAKSDFLSVPSVVCYLLLIIFILGIIMEILPS